VALCCIAAPAVPPAVRAQEPTRALGDSATAPNVGVIRPGDALKIVVYKETELSGNFLIDSRGYAQIPGVGDVPVAGLSPVAVKERLRAQLLERGIRDPQLSVQLLLNVSVLGEVRAPGPYPIEPGTSLLQLLTRAGGPTERANLRAAYVVREGRRIRVDLQAALVQLLAGHDHRRAVDRELPHHPFAVAAR
jgi:polysaccharide export outer membrane protein